MRCLYLAHRSDSALIRSLAESGFKLRVISPSELSWAREEGPFSLLVYEYSADSKSGFAEALAVRETGMAVVAILPEDNPHLRAELLRAGADYCLTQPVSVFELEAMLHSFFRRQGIRPESAKAMEAPAMPMAANPAPLRLNRRSHQLTWQNQVLPLSEREMRFLHVLMRSSGAATDRQTLWREVWGEEQEFNPQAMDLAISRLRRKLADCPVTLINLRGFGYRLSGSFEIE